MSRKDTSPPAPLHPLPAVILAAGRGSRLQEGNGGIPKPLTSILGLTLLERAVLSCREVGVKECYVVVGCAEEEVARLAEELGRRESISIQVVQNLNWEEGNGTSVFAVSPYLSGPFLLLMCDHLFDADILRRLMEARDESDVCLLAVDRRTDQIFDLKDATKIRLEGQAITAIGKEITPFDAVDTGLFLCPPILFDALEKAKRQGGGSLCAGIRELIKEGKIRAVEIGNRFWLDVDTPESLSYAKHHLLAGISKPSEDGFISHHLNRRLSRRISALLARTAITPNTITVLSFLICLCGAFLFSLGEYPWTLLAGLLVQIASVVDGCDGEIARLKFQSSPFGAWFDTVLDRYVDVAIAAGISYGYWLTHPALTTWLGGILSLTGFVLASYAKKEYTLRYGHKPPSSVLEKLSKRDLRLFGLFVGAVLNRPFQAMILLGLVSHMWIGWALLAAHQKRRHKLLEKERL